MDSHIEQPGSEHAPPTHATSAVSNNLRTGAFTNLLLYVFILAGLWIVQQIVRDIALYPGTAQTTHQPTHQIPPGTTPSTPSDNVISLVPYITIVAIDLAGVVVVGLLMATLEDRSMGVFGLGGNQSASRFLHGALWGLMAMSLLIGSLRLLHLVSFDTRLLHGPAIFGWGVSQLGLFLLVGIFEEYLFRGYIQFTLVRALAGLGNRISPPHARAIAFWIAALLTSLAFFIGHTANGGEDKLGLFQVFLAGIVFIVALWRTGSLWWAIGFHMAWDWAQSFLYGVPDSGGLVQGRLFSTHALGNPLYSGGTVGPEGSLLCAPVLLLVIVVLLYTHPSPQPPLESRTSNPRRSLANTTEASRIA